MLENWLRASFSIFSKSLLQGRVPHSLIIAGNPNLGSARLAIECAVSICVIIDVRIITAIVASPV